MQSNREFHALSEYIITYLKRCFYGNEKFQKLISTIPTKSILWKSGHEGAFIARNLFL